MTTFQSAGDDQIALAPMEELMPLFYNAPKFGVKLSEDKCMIYSRGAPFCE
jgi:hypothetical protein